MLSTQQKQQFGRDGYLVVEDAVDADLVAEGRDLIWDALPEDQSDAPETLRGVGSRTPDIPVDEPFTTIKQQLYEYGADLVGDSLSPPSGPHMQLALRYPKELSLSEYGDRRPTHGHLDGFGPGYKKDGQYSSWMVGAVLYFDDVPDRGGGFTVWPSSHWIAAEYFSEHALNTPGLGGSLPALDDNGGWDRHHNLDDQFRSRELNYPAGTLILWHNKIYHTSGVNQSDAIRMAGISRFSRDDQGDIFEDAADKPLKYWEGVPDIDPPR